MKKRCLILAVGALSGSSLAILNPSVDPGAYAPFIGQVNGSTGVVIAPNWVITARHVGGGPFMLGGITYVPDQVVIADGTAGSPNTDLALMHFATPFSSWSSPLYSEPIGQVTTLAGFGETGSIRPDGTGFNVVTGSSGTLRAGVQQAS